MKNICKVVIACIIMILIISSISFAANEYVLTRTYSYYNAENYTDSKAFLKVFIGQKDITKYQKDGDITITPIPDEKVVDEFGNIYAYYSLGDYKPGRTINIYITRRYVPENYDENIASRSEATVTLENEKYVLPQFKVESDEPEIIAKAKELASGLSSDYKKARAIFDFVNTTMTIDSSPNFRNEGALETLKNKRGLCENTAVLYAALCRALEIPCKIVTGYKVEEIEDKPKSMAQDLLTGEYYEIPATYKFELENHIWNEIYLDDYGWVPVDASIQYSKEGKKIPYTEGFGKIIGKDYIACGIYDATSKEVEFSKTIKEKSFSESLNLASQENETMHHFEDLEGFEWAEESIDTLYNMGVIKGYTDKEFGPAANITRIDFICMLARVLKNINYAPSTTGMIYYYLDYDRTHYSKQEYDFLMRCLEDAYPFDSRFAVGYGAMSNIFGSSLDMYRPITRGEVVALMDAFLNLPADGSAKFIDMLDSKFAASISKAYTNGLIAGYEDGTFKPNAPIRRAEIAVIFDRYVGIKDFVM